MKNIINTGVLTSGGVKPSSNATFRERVKRFFESIKILCHPELVSGSHQPEMLNIVDFIKSLFVRRFSMTYLVRAVAFTLAETLVVMGIIGVVAALTIPNLNQSTGDRESIAKLKKIYSNLNDASGRATAIYGPIDEWQNHNSCKYDGSTFDLSWCYFNRISEFLKVSKKCDSLIDNVDVSECIITGDEDIQPMLALVLADGSVIATEGTNWPDCDVDDQDYGLVKDLCLYVYIDINGKNKGKNQNGYDQFTLDVSKSNGIIPMRYDTLENMVDGCLERELHNASACDFWPFEFGNLDYLKADTSGKCSNGRKLSADNPSCN